MPGWFALTEEGSARRVTGLGIVIGRAPTSDIVLREPEVSRRHVLLQLGVRGQLDIVPLPGARTTVNGVAIEVPAVANPGDVIGFPGGAEIRLSYDGEDADDAAGVAPLAWLFEVGGRRIGLRREVLTIGGGDDDVMIEAWPAAASTLSWRDDRPWLTTHVDAATRNGVALVRGQAVALVAGDRLSFGASTITVVSEPMEAAPTHRDASRVIGITLEMLPAGGTITIVTTRGEHRALLSERRFALASLLLKPPAPYQPGEYIPDEVVLGAVWPRSDTANRGDLNQLVHRLRGDLRGAGVATPLVDRYAKGGATKFIVDANVRLVVSG